MSRRDPSTYDQHQFSDQQIQHFKEIFSEFDKDGDGTLDTKYVGTIMRSLGQSPTENELQNIIDEVDADKSGCMDFSEFLAMMADHMKEETDTIGDICTAFKAFDESGKGVISVEKLKHVLTNLGDALNDEELEELIKSADSESSGLVIYEDFVTKMMAGDKNEKKAEVVEEAQGEQRPVSQLSSQKGTTIRKSK